MIGWSLAAFALARKSSNSATVFGGFGHADLRRQLLVVEDAGQAVVEACCVQGTGAAGPIRADTVLGELGSGPLVPPEGCGVVVEILQQVVLDQRDHRRQPDQVRRVVTRKQPWRRADEVCELVLADLPGHVRELLRELLGQLERQIEAGLEDSVEDDRIGPTTGHRSRAGRRTDFCARGRRRGRGTGGRCGRG